MTGNTGCKWFDYSKIPKEFKNILRDFHGDAHINFECLGDDIIVDAEYVRCVPLNQLGGYYWNPIRQAAVGKWGNEKTLRQVPISKTDCGQVVSENLPYVGRDVKIGENGDLIYGDYGITDGNHRISRARELGLDCILCLTSDYLIIKESDLEKIGGHLDG